MAVVSEKKSRAAACSIWEEVFPGRDSASSDEYAAALGQNLMLLETEVSAAITALNSACTAGVVTAESSMEWFASGEEVPSNLLSHWEAAKKRKSNKSKLTTSVISKPHRV